MIYKGICKTSHNSQSILNHKPSCEVHMEVSVDLRGQVVPRYVSGRGYKTVFNAVNVLRRTVNSNNIHHGRNLELLELNFQTNKNENKLITD